MGEHFKTFVRITSFMTIGLLLTSCLELAPVNEGEAELPSEEVDEVLWLKGKSLYEQNCLSCHGQHSSSDVRNYSLISISDSIERVRSMNITNLKVLDQEALKAITYSLNNTDPAKSERYVYSCNDSDKRGMDNISNRPLSGKEIKNVLTDLAGGSLSTELNAKIDALIAPSMSVSPYEFSFTLPREFFEGFTDIAHDFAAEIIVKPSVTSLYSSCGDFTEKSCVRDFITAFSSRALRRPLAQADIDTWIAKWESDGAIDINVLVMSALLRPEFFSIFEEGSVVGQRARLSSYEVAQRLSFQTIGSIPDDALWADAKANKLQDLNKISQHTRRLLSSSRGKDKVKDFFKYWLSVEDNPQTATSAAFADGVNINDLYAAAKSEMATYVDKKVFGDKTNFTDLMISNDVYPETSVLASIMGTGVWSSGESPQSSSIHRGLLLRPATLIGGSNFQDTIRRGVMLRRKVLCDTLPTPTEDIINARDDGLTPDEIDHTINSNRVVVGNMTRSEACMTCHAQINPLGFALENFDSFGRYQSEERVFDSDDKLVTKHWILSSSDNAQISDYAPDTINDAYHLNEILSEDKKVKACFSRQWFEYRQIRNLASNDHCGIREQEKLLNKDANSVLDVLVEGIANEDIFWKKAN
jgi:hypothetical protein